MSNVEYFVIRDINKLRSTYKQNKQSIQYNLQMDTLYDTFEEPITLERQNERKINRTETLEVDPCQKMYRLKKGHI